MKVIVYRSLPGALIAFVALWIVGGFFLCSPTNKAYDSQLQRTVPNGRTYWRTEGWATTDYGALGLPGLPSLRQLAGRTIMLWGDSHVEALQVDDAMKMAAQVTSIWKQRAGGLATPLTALSWGKSNATFADHCFDIPRYERLIPSMRRHYLIVSFTRRLYPNDTRFTAARFLDKDGTFTMREPPDARESPSSHWVMRILSLTHANAVFKTMRDISKIATGKDLRISLGPAPAPRATDHLPPFSEPYSYRAFTWLLTQIKGRAAKPVTIVYTPLTPFIDQGKIQYCEADPDETLRVQVLARVCRDLDIGWINLDQSFREAYARTGQFPRGFPNSRPSLGHFNAFGHRLIAEAIVRDLEIDPP